MQFQGQTHLLPIEIEDPGIAREALRERFAAAYWRRFEVALPEIRPVLVNLHTAVIGKRRPIDLAALAGTAQKASLAEAAVAERPVWFAEGWRATPVYRRDLLPLGATFRGPAIVEQLDATTVIEPDDTVEIDRWGNLVVTLG